MTAQMSLFDAGLVAPAAGPVDYEGRARSQLRALLAQLRGGEPLSTRDSRMWRTVAPQMASWLPERERAELVPAILGHLPDAA